MDAGHSPKEDSTPGSASSVANSRSDGEPGEELPVSEADADQVLLAAVVAGGANASRSVSAEAAFAEVVRRYQHQLQVYAWRMTGDRDLAEDVVQEVFVTLLLELPRLMPIRHLRALLFRMTTNRCLNARRSRTRRREISLELAANRPGETSLAIGNVLASEERPAAAALNHAELTDLVFDALDDLPGRQRAAWVLKVLEHRPYTEIAGILDTTVGNCEVLVHRAARRLSTNRALKRFISTE